VSRRRPGSRASATIPSRKPYSLGVESLVVSEYGLREGIVAEALEPGRRLDTPLPNA